MEEARWLSTVPVTSPVPPFDGAPDLCDDAAGALLVAVVAVVLAGWLGGAAVPLCLGVGDPSAAAMTTTSTLPDTTA